MYVIVHIVYPAVQYKKAQKQVPNCLKIEVTSVILIVFIEVICDISTYPAVTVSFCRSFMNQVPEKL